MSEDIKQDIDFSESETFTVEIENMKKVAKKVELEEEAKLLEPHADLPDLIAFCITFCDYELHKYDETMRQVKRERKGTIKLQNQLKYGTEHDLIDILKNFPEFNAAHEELNNELYRIDQEVLDMNERKLKAEAMEQAIVDQGIEVMDPDFLKDVDLDQLDNEINNNSKGESDETNED